MWVPFRAVFSSAAFWVNAKVGSLATRKMQQSTRSYPSAGGSVRLAAERPQPYYITDLGTLGGKLRSGKTWLHSLTGSEKFEPGMPDLRSRGSQGHGGRFSNSQPNSDKLLRAIVLA
jgi:hypothetical protein